MSLADSIAAALEGRCRLLVFDNCEHVLDAAADMIETILAAFLHRHDPGHQSGRPAARRRTTLAGAVAGRRTSECRPTLFVERARRLAPASHCPNDDGDAVAEICRRLDGIPLAIELAASRMQSMTVTELRDRLDDRFRLLIGARRGLERHQTLRHAVQWSYDLLDADEKALLQDFGVRRRFRPCGRAAPSPAPTTSSRRWIVLDALVRKSLVVADRSSDQTRFSMLETIRQFAEEQLVTAVAPAMRATHMPSTTPDGKPMSWRCGTARANARPTNGSLANCLTCVSLSAGPSRCGDLDTSATIAFFAGVGRYGLLNCGSPSAGPRS